MDTSIFLAQLMGPVLFIAAIALMLRPSIVKDFLRAGQDNRAGIFFMGIVGIVLGLAIVLSHNVWDGTWRTTITIIGWIAIIKGTGRLLAPEWGFAAAQKFASNKALMKIVVAVLFVVGLYLSYRGFM